MTRLWIGTYPAAGAGTPVGLGEGVWRVTLDDATGALSDATLVLTLPSPSYVTGVPGGPVVAALEAQEGQVATLAVEGDRLVERSRVGSGGAYPCHVSTELDGLLAVANYGSGTLGLVPVAPDGTASEPVASLAHEGSGPRMDRQEGPHAHFVTLTPDGRHVLVADLGTDEIRRYRRTADGVEPDGVAASLPPGTGPRHLAFAADGRTLYVAGELDVQVHVLTWDDATATGTASQTVPAVVGDVTGSGGGGPVHAVRHPAGSLPSHVVVDGGELLVAVRGADVLTRYRVGADGRLSAGRSHPVGGHWPRHFAVVGRWVVVALEKAHRVVVLDAEGVIVSTAEIPSPASVHPA